MKDGSVFSDQQYWRIIGKNLSQPPVLSLYFLNAVKMAITIFIQLTIIGKHHLQKLTPPAANCRESSNEQNIRHLQICYDYD